MELNFIRFFRRWRLLSFRKFLFLPHILTIREKITYTSLALLGFSFGLAGLVGIYLNITIALPDVGGTYREGLFKEPRTINPLFATTDSERDISRLVYSGLFTYDGEGRSIPDLAERFDMSSDGKVYTVFLREARWHDGNKVTADDILFTVKTIQNPVYKSVLRANWQGVNAETVDEKTIRFTLRSPYAPFIENLTVGILPKHLWSEAGPEQMPLHELNLKPVGSGPYRFDKFSQAKDGTLLWYQLTRNPDYHREGPYIKKIIFYFYGSEDDLLHALRRGTIDGYGPASAGILSELNPKKKNIVPVATPRVFGLFFNSKRNDILADRKVRQAIAYALDRNDLAQRAAAGGARTAEGPLPFLTLDDANSYSYDLNAAKKIMEDAGWKDLDNNGVREKTVKEGKKTATAVLSFVLATSDSPGLSQTADLIKEGLAKAGLEIIVEKRPLAELESEVIRTRNFDVLLFGELYGFESDPFAFWHSSQVKDPGLNVAQYANSLSDRLLEEARRISKPELRQEKYREFSKQIMKDIPAIFLYTQLYNYVLPYGVRGVNIQKITLPADRFNMINEWHLSTRRAFKQF